MTTLHYTFTLPDDTDFDYDYTPSKELWFEAARAWLEANDSDELRAEALSYGFELDLDSDLVDYVEQLDSFDDFVKDYCEEIAEQAFENDDEVAEAVRDAELYERDPYAYYGVSRSDFI